MVHQHCDEIAIRSRIDTGNDDWERLKHKCPQFPLRDEHLEMPHPIKKDRKRCERLQQLPDGRWLEQAYCTYHGRAEFSDTLGLRSRELGPGLVAQQHKAGKLLVVLGCVLFPFGGFQILNDLSWDRGAAADLMRAASGDARISRPHADERRLAGLMIEVMMIVWAVVVLAALGGCLFWAITLG